MPIKIHGVSIPDSQLAREATELVRDTEKDEFQIVIGVIGHVFL